MEESKESFKPGKLQLKGLPTFVKFGGKNLIPRCFTELYYC